jgi:hypothetical protein
MKKNITVGFMTKLNLIGGVMIKDALLFCAVCPVKSNQRLIKLIFAA